MSGINYERALPGVDLSQPVGDATGVQGEQQPSPGTEAVAPGTGAPPTEQTPPASPAGAQKTDTEQGGLPETVPYTRFKEVNDQLRSFKTLEEEYGYDADSLRQLAEWGDRFDSDPIQSWLSIAQHLDGLPPSVQQAVRAEMAALSTTQANNAAGAPASPSSPVGEQEDSPEIAELRAKVDRIERAREERERDEALEEVLTWWDQQDREQGVRSPSRETKLTFISGASAVAETMEDLRQRARSEYLLEREAILQESIVRPGQGPSAPRPVPGGAAPVQETPPKPKTLAEASRMVEEDVRAGRLKMD